MMIRSLLAAGLLTAAPAFALDINLPSETSLFKPSTLPGYALVQNNCMLCHSVHYIQSQPPASPRAYWEATVKKMKKPFGATFADADIPDMVDYLVKTYGAERPAATKPAASKCMIIDPARRASTRASCRRCSG
ncbi:cytochrome c [Duganella sp. BJB1802]|uniref:SorB family sulfite dehydrogenase c-type cytochrome subunit n=1 Tax=Duganella sp. BJB1802 TaxID=2744575 RepID=UPI001E40425D|nr:cytochrome c [Duganella sp. BJB1802]